MPCARARSAPAWPRAKIIVGKDHSDIATRLRGCAQAGDWLLFKGSRGMKMEKVLDELTGGKA